MRFDDLVPDRETSVVINCAGRTRSIIGAQTLINFGVTNEIFALENGTQGWVLASRKLEHGADRYPPRNTTETALRQAQARAHAVSKRFSVPFITRDTLAEWLSDDARTVFLLDVRSREEYLAGHLTGSQHAPGGQLVQATDLWIGVRGARIVVCDDTEVRAICTAHWLKQMGWDVFVLQGGIGKVDLRSVSCQESEFLIPKIEASSLLRLVADEAVTILDLRESKAFEAAHIDGAQWTIRPLLETLAIPENKEVVLVADDQAVAELVARDLATRLTTPVRLLDGGIISWREAGGNIIESIPSLEPLARIDFVTFTAERHGGNKDHMRQYLEWEINLVNQLDAQERAVFTIAAP